MSQQNPEAGRSIEERVLLDESRVSARPGRCFRFALTKRASRASEHGRVVVVRCASETRRWRGARIIGEAGVCPPVSLGARRRPVGASAWPPSRAGRARGGVARGAGLCSRREGACVASEGGAAAGSAAAVR
jgi:hypothetical protein